MPAIGSRADNWYKKGFAKVQLEFSVTSATGMKETSIQRKAKNEKDA
jgi:hypothetical protein